MNTKDNARYFIELASFNSEQNQPDYDRSAHIRQEVEDGFTSLYFLAQELNSALKHIEGYENQEFYFEYDKAQRAYLFRLNAHVLNKIYEQHEDGYLEIDGLMPLFNSPVHGRHLSEIVQKNLSFILPEDLYDNLSEFYNSEYKSEYQPEYQTDLVI